MKLMAKITLMFLLSFFSSQSFAIVNGKPANPEDFLFYASLYTNDYHKFTCGSTILNDTYLLTAAHCVEDQKAEDFVVLVNSFNDRNIKLNEYKEVEEIIIHEDYGKEVEDLRILDEFTISDIAIIKLKHPIIDNVSSVTFSDYNKKDEIFAIGKGRIEDMDQIILETKYGTIKDIEHILIPNNGKKILRIANLVYDIDNEFCENDLLICIKSYNEEEKTFKITAKGDSGGPALVYNKEKQQYEQIGVTSYSTSFYNGINSFAAFTYTEAHMEFINKYKDKGKPLKYDPKKGHNNFVSLGDGKKNIEVKKEIKDENENSESNKFNDAFNSFFSLDSPYLLIFLFGIIFSCMTISFLQFVDKKFFKKKRYKDKKVKEVHYDKKYSYSYTFEQENY